MHVCELVSVNGTGKNGKFKLEMVVSFEVHARNLEFKDTVRVDLDRYEFGVLLRPESVKTKKGKHGTIYTIKLRGEM